MPTKTTQPSAAPSTGSGTPTAATVPEGYWKEMIARISARLKDLAPNDPGPNSALTLREQVLDLARRLAQKRTAATAGGTGDPVGACHYIRGGVECFVNATKADCEAYAFPETPVWDGTAPYPPGQERWATLSPPAPSDQ